MVETFFADGHELYRGYVQVGFKNFNLERSCIHKDSGVFLKFAITKKGQLEVQLFLLLSCNFMLQRAEWVKNLLLTFIGLS